MVEMPRRRLWDMARNSPDPEGYFDALMVAHGHERPVGKCLHDGGIVERLYCELGRRMHDDCREDRLQKVGAVLERWGGRDSST